ncbi:MAG: DUF5818 domain-containing protein [Terracidiphilus sp.]|jgi:uncharacterized protein YdeI (BOF family)
MQSIKRDLAHGFTIGTLALACALAWGSPFAGASSARAQDQAQPPQQGQQQQPDQSKSATFTGTIVKDGEQYSLRDSSGQVYKLDDPDRAKPFEGKTVKVTGQLDEQAKVIHVENIEGAEA